MRGIERIENTCAGWTAEVRMDLSEIIAKKLLYHKQKKNTRAKNRPVFSFCA